MTWLPPVLQAIAILIVLLILPAGLTWLDAASSPASRIALGPTGWASSAFSSRRQMASSCC